MSTEIQQTRDQIKKYKGMLTDPNCTFSEQTWIELQLIELRKWLRLQIKEQRKLTLNK